MQFSTHTFPSRRSNVMARNGIVATSQPLAAQAGLDVLRDGGNALDAAIATVATLCVVEPTSTGIGGDAFALIWWQDEQKLYGLNASGPSPRALTTQLIREKGHDQMPRVGPLTVTVPGSLRGWQMALQRFGSKPLASLLQRPIDYAQNGYPVSERIAAAWKRSEAFMSEHHHSRRVWVPGGSTPAPGDLFRNPEFAATLQHIATAGAGAGGIDAFYEGDIAQQIAHTVQEAGGVLTTDDLAAYAAEWVEPLSAHYRNGYTFHEIPPNGQGLAALLALNIARDFDFASLPYDDPQRVHLLIEAMKLGFSDALAYVADPRHAPAPLDGLLSDAYTAQRRALISAQQALTPAAGHPPGLSDTVYLTVADRAGNMVSWIQSLYGGFGSGLTAGTTGVQLQNRGANFTLQEGHPNQAAPGKRPYHTIIPGFITHEGQAWASFGVMGGFMQPQGHLQVGVNLIDYAMSPQAALDAPRFRWIEDKKVTLEESFAPRMRQALSALGHQLVDEHYYGGGQIIVRDPHTGAYIAGSEPRNDGAAVGY